MKNHLKALAAVLALSASVNAHALLIIDNFSADQTTLIDSGAVDGIAQTSETGPIAVLGGYRELSILKTAGGDSKKASIGVADGVLSYDNDSLTTSVGKVTWDGQGSTGLGGGLGIDLTQYGNTFVVDVVDTQLSSFIKLIATSASGSSEFTLAVGAIDTYFIALNQLVGGATLTAVTKLELILGGGSNADIAIDTINVPEPASLALVGLSLLGLGAIRRRRA